jgi:hypothetical protein
MIGPFEESFLERARHRSEFFTKENGLNIIIEMYS